MHSPHLIPGFRFGDAEKDLHETSRLGKMNENVNLKIIKLIMLFLKIHEQ